MGKLDRFVAACSGIGKNVVSIRNKNPFTWIIPAVAARKDTNLFAALDKYFSDHCDQRRLSGPAGSKVTNAYRPNAKRIAFHDIAVVQQVPQIHELSIKEAKWWKENHRIARKFLSIVMPCSVRIDSG